MPAETAPRPLLLPEWTPQDAVLLAWPHPETDWAANLERIEATYLELISQITRFQKVVLLVHDTALASTVQARLQKAARHPDRIIYLIIPYNDTWLRDSGPVTTQTAAGLKLLDFRFNGWGGKFDARLDDEICTNLAESTHFDKDRFEKLDLFLEGGSIDSDGAGTLLTTEQCLLSSTRNPDMSPHDYDLLFQRLFGTSRVFWIQNSELIGDDTDGHIDMLARFCNQHTIAYTSCDDENDPQFPALHAMQNELQTLRTEQRQPYTLYPLPIPAAKYNQDGQRLPASYANFLIINNAVLVPLYEDAHDQVAMTQLAQCFPQREIIGINALPIIEQFGSLHCLTMQLPQGALRSLN